MTLRWDRYIHNLDDDPVMLIKNLVHVAGVRLDLHCFVKEDKPGCFHTHPAVAVRAVLRGGYIEEVGYPPITFMRECGPGYIGRIHPAFCHRLHRLLAGPSWSLWLRGRVVAPILLIGPGWPVELQGKPVESGHHDQGKDL